MMPIATFHLVGDRYPDQAIGALLTEAAGLYARVLESPPERIRAFVQTYSPRCCLVAGKVVGADGIPAPFFEFIVLAGRPVWQRHDLLAGFTDLVVKHLGTERELVRGRAIQVEPEDWAIGGVPASRGREAEIRARAEGRG